MSDIRKATPLIGLTGGIACGKSAVSERLQARGAVIVDADRIAREVLIPGSEGLRRVVARWGVSLLNDKGGLNRAVLGEIVFSDPEERIALEEITHPLIASESARQIEEALSGSPPLVVYDAALLIEAGRAERFRPLVVVTTSSSVQLDRIMRRDHLSEEEAQARVSAQLPLSEKASLADYLIDNSGDWAALDRQLEILWSVLTHTK